MHTIIINIKDQDKYTSFLQFIKQLDFIKFEQPSMKIASEKEYDFFASAGIWKNKDIKLKELREKAWDRIK